MATSATQGVNVRTAPIGLPGRRYDHQFFTVTAIFMLATVLAGFAPTYFLAGVFHAPLPSKVIHFHGAAFTLWMILLIVQNSLVYAGRTDIHKKLGMAGFVLGCAMVVLGVSAATDSLTRGGGVPGRDPLFFYIVPLTDMVVFGTLLFFAYRKRFDSASHKRLIYLATASLLIAAVARLPFGFLHRNAAVAGAVSDIFLLVLIAYDLWSLHKIHKATLWAGILLVTVQFARLPIGHTQTWHSFAGWVQGIFR